MQDDILIKGIREKYEYHLNQANVFKSMLDVYYKSKSLTLFDNDTLEQGNLSRHLYKPNIWSAVTEILLRANSPMTLNELYLAYQEETKSDVSRVVFGIRLSQFKKLRKILNIALEDSPKDQRVWWFLPEWSVNDKPKPEYMDKIKNKLAQTGS
ncbi:MAG: hypothetical protein JWN76_2840 [Chitinophagaceae bacterium]|nr:hypothetical protein [Chitinophagaceae bacterium]